jgi:hypothetical protein
MKKFLLTALTAVAVASPMVAPAIASASNHAPNVRCTRLDIAERIVASRGFRYVQRGGGLFGIVLRSDWVVVHESQSGRTVYLTAGRYC